MRLVLRRSFIWVAAVAVFLIALSFGTAALVAEGALHPILKRRASDTAALAHGIAAAVDASATRVTMRAQDQTLLDAWWLVPHQANGHAVIVCHGIADSAYGALGFTSFLLKNGYSVLIPESRGHGQSSGFVTFGVLEADDVAGWVHWLKQQRIDHVFGLGESLGGVPMALRATQAYENLSASFRPWGRRPRLRRVPRPAFRM